MNVSEYEYKILKSIRKDMFKAIDRDGINKVYRQARIWNRLHHFYGKANTYQKYTFLNHKFKQARLEALAAIQ